LPSLVEDGMMKTQWHDRVMKTIDQIFGPKKL
jgi:hypothetical protein